MKPRGLRPALLLPAYTVIALLPLALAALQGLPPRPFLDELSSAVALVAFSMLLVEFVLSGRFQLVSGRIGIDITMRFHQLIARGFTVFILAHPFLYTLPMSDPLPWDATRELTLNLPAAALITGGLAWLLLPALVLAAIFRRDLPFRYETWRLLHGLGATLIALLTLHHVLSAGRYSTSPALTILWLVLTAMALLTLLQAYVFTPLLQRRHPYRVVSIDRIAERTWELVIEPYQGEAIEFAPGQFVWLTLGRSPFAITEHPFSISSCPAERPRLGFAIKENGDFTGAIGTVAAGTRAYIDGPHGNVIVPSGHAGGVTFIAGGVGLAPIMSILRQMRVDGDRRKLELIYGNRIAEQIMYESELEAMAAELDLTVHYTLSEPPAGWTGKTGVIDEALLTELLASASPDNRLYVVCGPTPMIDNVQDILGRLDVPGSRVLFEKFSYD